MRQGARGVKTSSFTRMKRENKSRTDRQTDRGLGGRLVVSSIQRAGEISSGAAAPSFRLSSRLVQENNLQH